MLNAPIFKEKALALGFDLVGIAPAGPAPHGGHLLEWMERGYSGEMGYMTRSVDARADTRVRFPWARSVLCVAMRYPAATHARESGEAERQSAHRTPAPPGDDSEKKGRQREHKAPATPLVERAELRRQEAKHRETHQAPPALPHRSSPESHRPSPHGTSEIVYGRVSFYARADDYHDVMGRALAELESFAREHGATQTKSYVDTGPILERDWAARAGLGWTGKNTMLINQRLGSWLFLGTVLLDLELDADEPFPDRCGTCTQCIDACPTGALVAPYLLDSRLCISYLTIEHKGMIPQRLRPLIGDWVFGCDICQMECPWNDKVPGVESRAFAPRPGLDPLDVEWALKHPDALSQLTAGTPVERAKGNRLIRNMIVAAGNSGSPHLTRALEPYAVNPPPELAEHVGWALKKLRR